MAINKKKNVMLQITMPKETYKKLVVLKESFEKEKIKVTKSDILVFALENYLKTLVQFGLSEKQKAKDKVEEPQKEKIDA